MRTKSVVFLFFLLVIPAFADQVVLKNGDKLSGTIEKSDGKELVIKTEFEGEVTIKFDAIQTITSTGDLNVSLGTKTVVGPVTTSGDNVVVATKAAGSVEAPISTVTTLRSPAEEAAYQKTLHPGLWEGWNGGLNVGFALTGGNSQTTNLNIAFNAVRKGLRDKLILYTTSVYATNNATSPSQTTANSAGGGLRYDHDITPRIFGFANADFYSDALQDLDLRSTVGGGLGWHAIKSDATTLDLLAGANYTHESYSAFLLPPPPPGGTFVPAVTRNLGALTLGDAFTHKFGAGGTILTQGFFFFPDLTDTGEYRGTFNLGTVTKLHKWLGWQNSFADVYVSNPPMGKKKNDVQFATGLSFSFTH